MTPNLKSQISNLNSHVSLWARLVELLESWPDETIPVTQWDEEEPGEHVAAATDMEAAPA